MTEQPPDGPPGVSRDDAREIAVIALLAVAAIRIVAGVLQALEEFSGAYTWESVLSRFLAPVGATLGVICLAAVVLVVLAPNGSVTPRLLNLTRKLAGLVMTLGMLSAVLAVSISGTRLAGIWIAMNNGLAAAILAGAGWWILKNFNSWR